MSTAARSIFGKFDIMASRLPSNVLVLLLSKARSLEGVGFFGRANDDAIPSDRLVTEADTSPSDTKAAPLRLLDRLKRQFGVSATLPQAPPVLPSQIPEYIRSRSFWVYDQTSPPGSLSWVSVDADLSLIANQSSKRFTQPEIELLKSRCTKLGDIWV